MAYSYAPAPTAYNKHNRRKAKPQRNEIKVLLTMCVAAILALGTVVTLTMASGMDFNLTNFFANYGAKDKAPKELELSGVKLGTTIDALRARHPAARKGLTTSGAITMTFQDQGLPTMVWYGENGPSHVAYKMRQTSFITGMSEDEYVGQIVERYGAPSLASCSRRVSGGIRDCQFSWWVPGQLRLDLNSRQHIGNDREASDVLKITTQVTDTRLEGRFKR